MPETHLRNRNTGIDTARIIRIALALPIDRAADMIAVDEVLLASSIVGTAAVADPPEHYDSPNSVSTNTSLKFSPSFLIISIFLFC